MKWLIYGILSAILFGLWGLFDKLSAFQNPVISNVMVYLAALLFSFTVVIIANRRIRFSGYGLVAGIFGGTTNFLLLNALLNNYLILVMPFVSAASVVFFLIIYLTERPKYSARQKALAATGMMLCVSGLFLVSVGSVGISDFMKEFSLDSVYVLVSIAIMFSVSLWTYFTYKSVQRDRTDAFTYNFWNILSSFTLSVILLMIIDPGIFPGMLSLDRLGYIYPSLSGIAVAAGSIFTFMAFGGTTTKTKLQEIMVAIIANGDVIPLLFFSYFILGEWVTEGFIGVIIVLAGLFTIHYAEACTVPYSRS